MSELVVEAAAPATWAFEDDVLALRPRLVRRLTIVLGDHDEAEDLAQETCLRAIRHEADFQGDELWPWLQVIGVRLALNELRRRRRALATALRAAPAPLVPADLELWDALRRLPRNQRAALVLHATAWCRRCVDWGRAGCDPRSAERGCHSALDGLLAGGEILPPIGPEGGTRGPATAAEVGTGGRALNRRSLRHAVVVLAGLVACQIAAAQPVAAFSYPGYVASWYMDTVSTTTLYDMGCALGDAREGGSAPQDALVVLDFGQAQLRDGVYGTYDFSNHYRTVTQIKNAVVAYAHGFWLCTGSNLDAHVRIGVGTSNYANFCKNCGMTNSEVTGFGVAWANMVDSANTLISSAGYAGQADAVGAADIEVGWGTSGVARLWVDGYDSANSWPMYDYGDAAGCRQSGTTSTSALCSGTWYQDDLYYIAWGNPAAWGVPEIYREDAAQAKQWQQISKWATLNSKTRISFVGAMTQHAACSGSCADAGLDNSPQEGWTQLRDRCASDSATTLSSLRFATDIRWH